MTERRELERRLRTLGEISGIMNSMKSLAVMETRKLGRFLESQQQVVRGIEAIAADFIHFHPMPPPPPAAAGPVYLLIGAERGFCGDFNVRLLEALERELAEQAVEAPRLIAVGHRLVDRLQDDARTLRGLDGASVAEEVPEVLMALIEALHGLQGQGLLTLKAVYHDGEQAQPRVKPVLPPFRALPAPDPRLDTPPHLYLAPGDFWRELLDHYLFAELHALFYTSLMAESLHRVQHLDAALRHMDEELERLGRKRNALRQEEITEEIELIMLNVLGGPIGPA